MRTWLDASLTALAIVFAVPAFLILASWNALPGDSLYTVKTSLEKVALAITIKTPLATMLSLNFTDRRFNEANRLLAKDGSTLGYTLLVSQATQSKDIVTEKQDIKQATALIQNIEAYQKSIEEKKTVLATQPSAIVPSSVSTHVSAPTPAPIPTIQPPTPTAVAATPIAEPTPAPSVEVVIDDLNQTNDELEKLKDQIKIDVPGAGFKESDNGNIHINNRDNNNREKKTKD